MVTSALDLITGAAKLIGVLFKSETLASDEANDGLTALNDMLDTWSNDDLVTFAMTLESFPLTGAASYTIGTGGDFNTSRPISIVDAVVRLASVDYPLQIITQQQYQTEIPVKSIAASIPQVLTYDNGYPLGTIKMYAVPLSGSTLYLQSNKPLSNISALSATVDMPPGWKEAIRYNLAIRMAPEYGAQIPPSVVETAKRSLGAIRSSTLANNPLPFIEPSGIRYSIYSGTE